MKADKLKLATKIYNAIEDTDVSPERFEEDLLEETVADHCRIAARVAYRHFGGEARDARVAERMKAAPLPDDKKAALKSLALDAMRQRKALEATLAALNVPGNPVDELKATIYAIFDLAKEVTA